MTHDCLHILNRTKSKKNKSGDLLSGYFFVNILRIDSHFVWEKHIVAQI